MVDLKNGAVDPKIVISAAAATPHTATSFLLVAIAESLIFLGLYTEKSGEGAMAWSQAECCSPETRSLLEELCVALSLMFNSSFPRLV